MNNVEPRITLIAQNTAKSNVDWNYPRLAKQRVSFVDSNNTLRFALNATAHEAGLDIERVVLDHTGKADDFLELLARTPANFLGDLMFIREDGSGFLSATGRGSDRVMYALGAEDVRFYLETNNLVTGRADVLRMSA